MTCSPIGYHGRAAACAALALATSGCALIAGVEEGQLDPNAGAGAGTAGSRYAAEVLGDGPVGYWRLGEETTPTAFDASGHGRDGTYSGISLGAPGAIAGDDDTAAHFDGDASVTVGDVFGFEGQAPFTIEAWIRPEIEACSFLGKSTFNGSSYDGWLFYFQDTELTLRRGFNLSGPNPPLGQFTHVVATYDGVTLVQYQNGQQVADRAVDSAVVQHADPFTIGRTPNWVAFQGVIDEVAVYDRNLAPARILAHYQVGAGAR